jgi:rhomboid protease GluP
MNESPAAPYEGILKLCAQAAPSPWYPADFAREKGMERAHLDEPLDQLRLAGLIELTDWVSGKGQGYRLTPNGEAVLHSPRLLTHIRAGQIPIISQAPQQPAYDGTPWSRGEAIRNSLAYPRAPRVTQVLIALNLLVFAVGFFIASQNGRTHQYLGLGLGVGDLQTTHTIGSLSAADLAKGEWWRLLACCFVHYGVLHIGMNMYALWVVGRLAEQIWGHWRYLTIYLVAGLCGSCAAVLTSGGAPSAGASGAIWGVLACLPAWLFLNRRHLPQRLVSEWMRQLITVLIINAVISFLPGISWGAHFGGGAAGLVAAVLLNTHRFSSGPLRWICLLLVPLLPLVCVGAVVRAKDSGRLAGKANNGVEPNADRREQREIDRINERLIPEIGQAIAQAEKAYGDAEDLRRMDAAARDQKDVAAAIQRLQKSGESVKTAAQDIDAAGEFESDFVRQALSNAKRYCEHATRRAEMLEECLLAAKWPKDKDEALDREIERTDKARWKYQANIR